MTRTGDGTAVLQGELKNLRKGRGINGSGWGRQVGAGIRRVSAVVDGDSDAVAKGKIVTTLDRLMRRLSPTNMAVARAALGFDSEPDERYLKRLVRLEPELKLGSRSLQRYSDEALALLAEIIEGEGRRALNSAHEPPWRTEVLRTTLLLDGSGAEVTEARRIRSSQNGLHGIEHSLTVRPAHMTGPLNLADVNLRAVFGADVSSPRLVTSCRIVFDVHLPEVLDDGNTHEFEFRALAPNISPFYLCTPIYPCEEFELKVRFDRANPPRLIRVVDGALAHEANDPAAATGTIALEPGGQVRREFRDLRPGRSYGLSWEPLAN
ncbi:hypothetical protein [Crossiella sp. NPDC003009]